MASIAITARLYFFTAVNEEIPANAILKIKYTSKPCHSEWMMVMPKTWLMLYNMVCIVLAN
jgi:hypothetical protein